MRRCSHASRSRAGGTLLLVLLGGLFLFPTLASAQEATSTTSSSPVATSSLPDSLPAPTGLGTGTVSTSSTLGAATSSTSAEVATSSAPIVRSLSVAAAKVPTPAPPKILEASIYYPSLQAGNTGSPSSRHQTALKKGDQTYVVVTVQDDSVPEVTAALKSLSGSTTTQPLPDVFDYSNSNLGTARIHQFQSDLFTVSATAKYATTTMPISVTDALGRRLTMRIPVTIDNTLPTLRIDTSKVATSTDGDGDSLFLSGSADGVGTPAHVSSFTIEEILKRGGYGPSFLGDIAGQSRGESLNAISSGRFTDIAVPLDTPEELFPDGMGVRVTMTLQDEAGNKVSTTSTAFFPQAASTAASNVLFLPGVLASRLYTKTLGVEDLLYEANTDLDLAGIALRENGTSPNKIYTKEDDIIDYAFPLTSPFTDANEVYGPFIDYMNSLVADGTIHAWKPYAYDWRYDVFDIVKNGTYTKMKDGTYKQLYLTDTLQQLASSSPTGKVTIIAHSNGGLLAKALLATLAKDHPEKLALIDKVIMVATPQYGTPKDIAVMLHGDESDIGIFTSAGKARTVAYNLPSFYGLLPSDAYFKTVSTPPILFSNDELGLKYQSAFGPSIDSESELERFLTDSLGVTTDMPKNLATPLPLRDDLIQKEQATHAKLDVPWSFSTIPLTQIVGWGQDTISQLTYTTTYAKSCPIVGAPCVKVPRVGHALAYTQDGDGTVVTPSAVGKSGSIFYFDAKSYKDSTKIDLVHRNILSSGPILTVVRSVLTNSVVKSPYIQTSIPTTGKSPLLTR